MRMHVSFCDSKAKSLFDACAQRSVAVLCLNLLHLFTFPAFWRFQELVRALEGAKKLAANREMEIASSHCYFKFHTFTIKSLKSDSSSFHGGTTTQKSTLNQLGPILSLWSLYLVTRIQRLGDVCAPQICVVCCVLCIVCVVCCLLCVCVCWGVQSRAGEGRRGNGGYNTEKHKKTGKHKKVNKRCGHMVITVWGKIQKWRDISGKLSKHRVLF